MRKIVAFPPALAILLSGCAMIDDGTSQRYAAYMTGGLMAPGVRGDPDGSGMALLSAAEHPGLICYNVSVRKTAPVTEAHLHMSPAQARWAADGPAIASLNRFRRGKSSGCFARSAVAGGDLRRQLQADPSIFYVDVHSAEFPGGALRGKLEYSKPRV